MAIIDDLREAVTGAISAGAKEARAQGVALKGDFEDLVKPQLDDIVVQIAAITNDFVVQNISKEQAQDDLATQVDRIKPIVLGVAELALLSAQIIINTVLDALKTAVNSAAGIALL